VFKRAARSTMTHPESARPVSQGDKGPPLHAVVVFRRGRDNQGRERVYRRLWSAENKVRALNRFRSQVFACAGVEHYVATLEDGRVTASHGRRSLVDEWEATRRGLNKGADPFTASRYMSREGGGAADYRKDRGHE
jgi:hypothetical protein